MPQLPSLGCCHRIAPLACAVAIVTHRSRQRTVMPATLEWQVVLVVTWSFSSVRAYKHDYCTAKTRVIFLLESARASCDETADDVRCCVTIGAAPARWVDLCRDRKDRTIGIRPIDSLILAFTSKLADSQFVACPG